MTWRCANKRKGRRMQLASVEPYLGDMIGQPLAPMRRVVMDTRPDWLRRGVQAVVTTVGITFGAVLLLAVVVSFFVAASHGH